jgi:RNA polymerase sigma-70 factor, ECF subfamily
MSATAMLDALGQRAPAACAPHPAIDAMARYCEGEAAAFRALYALAAPRLFTYLLCMVRDRPLAEELLQQTFLKLHVARASYVVGADPMPWLYTIAHRTCLDELRRSGRSRVRVASDWRGLVEPAATLAGDAETAQPTYDEGTIRAVLHALDQLPEPLRDAVVLTKIHGHSLAEAATILGVTPTAVKLRAHRGYVRLRAALRKLEGAWPTGTLRR